MTTYVARKALPTPLASKRLHGWRVVAQWFAALLALGQTQTNMALLTIRVSFVHRETHVIVFCNVQRQSSCGRQKGSGTCVSDSSSWLQRTGRHTQRRRSGVHDTFVVHPAARHLQS